MATNTSKLIYQIPEIENLTSVWFLDLRVFDANNNEIDNSIYWLSVKPDVLDYEAAKKLEWPFYTPTKEYADFKALDQLPEVKLECDYEFETVGEDGKITLRVKNPGESIAFFTFFDVVNPVTQEPVLPVFWSDNYITLLPGEARSYTASFLAAHSNHIKPLLKIKAWNVEPVVLK